MNSNCTLLTHVVRVQMFDSPQRFCFCMCICWVALAPEINMHLHPLADLFFMSPRVHSLLDTNCSNDDDDDRFTTEALLICSSTLKLVQICGFQQLPHEWANVKQNHKRELCKRVHTCITFKSKCGNRTFCTVNPSPILIIHVKSTWRKHHI